VLKELADGPRVRTKACVRGISKVGAWNNMRRELEYSYHLLTNTFGPVSKL